VRVCVRAFVRVCAVFLSKVLFQKDMDPKIGGV